MKLKQRAKTTDRETVLNKKNVREGARAILGDTQTTKIKWAPLTEEVQIHREMFSFIEMKHAQIKENCWKFLLLN